MEEVGAVKIRTPQTHCLGVGRCCLFLKGMLKHRQVANEGKRAVE